MLKTTAVLRLSKCALVLSMGLFALLAGTGNLLDPGSNLAFVQHVLSMDTTFPDNQLRGRAITSPSLHLAAFGLIVAAELLVAGLCLWGGVRLWRARHEPAAGFNAAKGPAAAGLTLGVLLWFTGFLVVGGEWFLMWQSEIWNGIASAFRFAASLLLTLIFLAQEDRD